MWWSNLFVDMNKANFFNFSFLPKYATSFVRGLEYTLLLAVVSVLLAIIPALLLALMRLSKNRIVRSISGAYIALFRSTPLLVQLSLNVFGSLDILPFTGVTFPFVSRGGTSLLSCWMLMAFIKGSDTRREGSFAVKPVTAESRVEEDEDEYEEDDYDEEDAE